MGRLKWDETGERLFETGIDQGVIYPWDSSLNSGKGGYGTGVEWNGLTSVNESPSGAEATALYADNIKYLNMYSAEEFGLTVEAYMYPDEFAVCDGSEVAATGMSIYQQSRKSFALCYRTKIGSDTDDNDHGYKIHIVYGCKASPSERSYATINDSPEAITFSWEITTTPVTISVEGKSYKPTSLVTIDSTKFTSTADQAKLKELEDLLYGTDADPEDPSSEASDPTLPSIERIIEILGEVA